MNGISKSLQDIGSTYSSLMQEYSKKGFVNSALDESFKDSNENIFIGDLKTLIESDRVITCNQDGLALEIVNISEKIKLHLDSLRRRQYQSAKAKRRLKSEFHYLTDWKNRLWLSKVLTENCLVKIDEIGKSLADAPKDQDFVLVLLNKCTVLSRIPYLQKEFLETLRDLNKRVQTKSGQFFNSNLYFRLGTLNFSAHNYLEAREQLLLAVAKLEAREDALTDEEIEMLFYAHLEIVMAYEFCGKYREALAYLIDAETGISETDICSKYLLIFRDSLGDRPIETLSFRSEDSVQKLGIIELLTPILNRDSPIFPGRMARFAVVHRKEFSDRVAEYNSKVDSLIDSIEFDSNSKTNNEKKEKVKSSAHKKEEQNQAFHDYLHLVAHCLNELGAELINDFDPNAAIREARTEELAHQTIILARALMLFVSEAHEFYSDCHMYKSCFATVFAEVGDFDIAEQELLKILSDQKYPELDVVGKAEIDFFTYRVRRMKKISSGELDYLGDDNDTQYNHYLNLCYRLFDYDAIAHMSLICFEYYLSNILHEEDLENISKYFSLETEQSKEFELHYFTFWHDTEGDSHNNWLNLERKKVEYFVKFLRSFFRTSEDNYLRDINIFDLASTCIHYCDVERARDDAQVRFISFPSVTEVIEGLKAILPVDRYYADMDYVELAIGTCTYFDIKTEKGMQEFMQSLEKTNNMFFIQSKIEINKYSLSYEESSRIRAFDTDLDALREFFLLCAFMQIRADFTDPKSIFVLTPINNEGLCRYEVANFDTLLSSVIEDQKRTFVTAKEPLNNQYKITVAGHNALSTGWLRRLNTSERWIKWAVSFLVDTDDPRGTIRYSLDVPGNTTLNAVMFRKTDCLSILDKEFKPPWHGGRCNAISNCHICSVIYSDALQEKLLLSFAELPSVQKLNGKLLIWKQSQEAYVCWRLVLTLPNNQTIEDDIKQLLCNNGSDAIFERIYDRSIVPWPEACKPEEGKFLFICHSGLDDELVKNELNDYFVHHKIRFWYDSSKIIDEENWLVRVNQIINHENCVGCVILVTNREIFKSNAIRREFEILDRKKQGLQGRFPVMPVFYNLGNSKNIEELIRISYGLGDTNQNAAQTTCQSLIIPHSEHVSIYLNAWEGNSLCQYHERETEKEKRKGSLLQACTDLNVLNV